MKLEDLGYSERLEERRQAYDREHGLMQDRSATEPGRIIAEHKERYIVATGGGEVEAEITGHMRFAATGRADFPAVGDWVLVTVYDTDFAIIHSILPRSSILQRQAVGQFGEIQIIATNVDFAFLVQAVDRDFNVNRLERYLSICHASKVNPIIVLTKTDLIDAERLAELRSAIEGRIHDVPILTVSNVTHEGCDELRKHIEYGKTYCMLGSSGVGKSSLINTLTGGAIQKTGDISESTHKGRHVTTHRELIVLSTGGMLIDNPGMREVGLADATGGVEATFDRIAELSVHCRFADCTHTVEAGCAVIEAVEQGQIDRASYENYLKLERERSHFQSTVAAKRKKDKAFGKMLKNYHKQNPKQRDR